MDTKEIMTNEEVLVTAGEIATANSGKGFKVVAGVGLAVLTGVLAYKYVAKPMIATIKAKKEARIIDEAVYEASADVEVESVETE